MHVANNYCTYTRYNGVSGVDPGFWKYNVGGCRRKWHTKRADFGHTPFYRSILWLK